MRERLPEILITVAAGRQISRGGGCWRGLSPLRLPVDANGAGPRSRRSWSGRDFCRETRSRSRGAPGGFAEAAPLFAASRSQLVLPGPSPQRAEWIDTERPVDLVVKDGSACGHLGEIREVYPSAAGCEDCLRTGDRWITSAPA